jgi:hypothetical protein
VNATTTMPPEVADYLAEVRAALRDLPPDERDDLLIDVEASVEQAAAEGGAIAARLGPPAEFAAELRAAAGLHEAAPAPRHEPTWSLRETVAGVISHARTRRAAAVLRELAPLWWVARAYVAVAAYAMWTGADQWVPSHQAVPRLGGTAVGGALVIAAATAVSVALGLRGRRRPDPLPHLRVVANVVLVVAALPVIGHLAAPRYVLPAEQPQAVAPIPAGLAIDGVPVDNIYPYSRDGRLLYDVLLYDGAGRPIEVRSGSDDPSRRLLLTPAGKPIFNAFPIRYYEPGTQEVARPSAAPRVALPRIVTPPLVPGIGR